MRSMLLKNTVLAGAMSLLSVTALAAGPAATIEDLAWITGNYAGMLGPNQLEENWVKPEGGTIGAFVRLTGADSTSWFEVITVREKEGSLELSIQQFNTEGFTPRSPEPQIMELGMIMENHVHFVATGEGGFRTLGYTLAGDTFTIHVDQGQGQRDLVLQKRSLWE